MRPEEGSEEVGDWKDPYTRAMATLNDVRMADKVIWYSYRFPKYFLRSLDYSEDILHEILMEISKVPYYELFDHTVTRIARNTVARFLAKVGMTLSGYTNFRSWINRKATLAIRNENNANVITELEESVKEIEKIWNEGTHVNTASMVIADQYPLVMEFAESGLSLKNFAKLHNMSKYALLSMIDEAREEYISLTYIESYIMQ